MLLPPLKTSSAGARSAAAAQAQQFGSGAGTPVHLASRTPSRFAPGNVGGGMLRDVPAEAASSLPSRGGSAIGLGPSLGSGLDSPQQPQSPAAGLGPSAGLLQATGSPSWAQAPPLFGPMGGMMVGGGGSAPQTAPNSPRQQQAGSARSSTETVRAGLARVGRQWAKGFLG